MGRAAAAASSAARRDTARGRAVAPTRWASASRGRNGRGPTAPSAIRASATRPPASSADPGGDAHDRDRAAALQSELVPGLAAAVTRHHDLADQLARPGDRAARPQQEGVERDRPLVAGPREDDRGIERQQGHHEVGAGARIREVPAERRLVPREEVGEVPRRGRGARAAAPRRAGRRAARPTVTPPPIRVTPSSALDPPKLRELADVDEQGRLASPLAEVDQEIGAARQGLRRRILREERRRLEE